MPRKSKTIDNSLKRQLLSQESERQDDMTRKPRKVVKKSKEVSQTQKIQTNSSPLNFYQTIEQIPTYHLSKAQMNSDPIQLLNRLEEKYSKFGAVKIVVNDAWNAPFTFRYIDKQITTRIQCLQKLKEGKAFQQKVKAYRIEAFQAMAHNFTRQYKFKTDPQGVNLQSKCQQQYWTLVTSPEYEKKPVTVQYAADLSTSVYGSGFPVKKMNNWIDIDFEYQSNFFNLNNISKSPSSLLNICEKRKQKISGVSYPWLYMGMQFSTFCWHVEDLYLNSLNYNHKGATKTWYIVPGEDKQKFDAFVEKKFEGNSKKKNLLQKIILMVDPKQLIKEGIRVYKANQRPRQYVCTFLKAYHAGFSHGFNVGQAVNFLSAKSLKYIDQAQKYYNLLEKQKNFKPKALVLSKQWLIYENIVQNKTKNFSPQGQFYVRLEYEKMIQKEYFFMKQQLIIKKKLNSINSVSKVKILPYNIKYEKLSCSHCKNYIYLSAIQCKNCGILCENHIEKCNCAINPNQFQIWIRQPNADRQKSFKQYPVIIKALEQYGNQQQKIMKEEADRRSLTVGKKMEDTAIKEKKQRNGASLEKRTK